MNGRAFYLFLANREILAGYRIDIALSQPSPYVLRSICDDYFVLNEQIDVDIVGLSEILFVRYTQLSLQN